MPVQPYRVPARRDEDPARRGRSDPLWAGSVVVCIFLLGWSLLRVAICTVRGLDVEGVVAVIVIVTAAIALAAPSRPESSP